MRRFYFTLVVSLFAAIVLTANESSGNITQIPLSPAETENSPNLPRTLVQDIEAYHTNNKEPDISQITLLPFGMGLKLLPQALMYAN